MNTFQHRLPPYRYLVRPLLFALQPERAQRVADQTLGLWPFWGALAAVSSRDTPEINTSAGGLKMSNPVGLAAGYDKYCNLTPGLAALGFGYVTCGSVTLEARPGNTGDWSRWWTL